MLYYSMYISYETTVLNLVSHLAKNKVESIPHAEHHRKFQTDERFNYSIWQHTDNRRKHDKFLFKFGVKKTYLWLTFQKPLIKIEKINYIKTHRHKHTCPWKKTILK